MSVKETVLDCMGSHIRQVLMSVDESFFCGVKEIRVRIGKPVIILHDKGEYFVTADGVPTKELSDAYYADKTGLYGCIQVMSGHSLYAFEEELKNGYITLSGGHRVGICGRTIVDNRQIKTINEFNAINIRICREVLGCADGVYRHMAEPYLRNTMIISPPGGGKTTLLRDIIRQLSDKGGQTVAVVDERSEIAGSCKGVPQNQIGIRTDVLDRCPKEEGMLMLLRTMGPAVIAIDEIGKKQEIEAIEEIAGAGVKFVCSVHGYSIADIVRKPYMEGLLNKKIFGRYIILDGRTAGKVLDICDEDFCSVMGDDNACS